MEPERCDDAASTPKVVVAVVGVPCYEGKRDRRHYTVSFDADRFVVRPGWRIGASEAGRERQKSEKRDATSGRARTKRDLEQRCSAAECQL